MIGLAIRSDTLKLSLRRKDIAVSSFLESKDPSGVPCGELIFFF